VGGGRNEYEYRHLMRTFSFHRTCAKSRVRPVNSNVTFLPMPSQLTPSSFIEALAGGVMTFALFLVLLSLIPCIRSHATRLLAILMVAGLALFSNYWATYFAALFIVATAVTELEFLQNLAAILRGNKEYFQYKKEHLSREQVEKKVEKEQEQLAKGERAPRPAAVEPPVNVRRIVDFEREALRRMEIYFGEAIERNVRIAVGSRHFEFDGLIPSGVDDVKAERLIEVKYLRSPKYFSQFVHTFPRIEQMAQTYMKLRNKIAKLHVVLIVEGDERLNDEKMAELARLVNTSFVAGGYSVFSTKELSTGPVQKAEQAG
jgi:hypothetical protein